MNYKDVLKEFDRYRDRFGLVQPNVSGSSGNGNLYTAEALLIFKQADSLVPFIKEIFKSVLKANLREGTLMRNLDNEFGQNSVDDFIGFSAASFLIDNGDMAESLYDRGKKRFPSHYYNNINPNKFTLKSWILRQYNIICFLKFCAKKKLSIFEQLYWSIALIFNSFSKPEDTNSWIKNHLMISILEGNFSICDLAIRFWRWKFKKNYLGISYVYKIYFQDDEHPLVKYSHYLEAKR